MEGAAWGHECRGKECGIPGVKRRKYDKLARGASMRTDSREAGQGRHGEKEEKRDPFGMGHSSVSSTGPVRLAIKCYFIKNRKSARSICFTLPAYV